MFAVGLSENYGAMDIKEADGYQVENISFQVESSSSLSVGCLLFNAT